MSTDYLKQRTVESLSAECERWKSLYQSQQRQTLDSYMFRDDNSYELNEAIKDLMDEVNILRAENAFLKNSIYVSGD